MAPGLRSATSSSQARPTTTGPRKKLPWRFAQATTITGIAQTTRGRSRRNASTTSTSANSTIPNSCGRSPSATAETTNPASASHAARRTSAPRRRQNRNTRPISAPTRTARRTTSPVQPAEPVDSGEDHLGAPLLVEPRLAERGVRPRVAPWDTEPVEDLAASAQLVGEVDARQIGDQRRERGQQDSEGGPEPRETHPCGTGWAGAATPCSRTRPRRSPGRSTASPITTSDAAGGLTTVTIGTTRTAMKPATRSTDQSATTAGSSSPA